MRIQSSSVGLASGQTSQQIQFRQQTTLAVSSSVQTAAASVASLASPTQDKVSLQSSRDLAERLQRTSPPTETNRGELSMGIPSSPASDGALASGGISDGNLQTLVDLLREMFGMEVSLPGEISQSGEAQQTAASAQYGAAQTSLVADTLYFKQVNSLKFEAQGEITTADNQKISVAFSFEMQSEITLRQSTSVRVQSQAMRDPLVLNFDAGSAQLGQDHLMLDLDNNGHQVALPAILHGGYLALQSHTGEAINRGSQLFGPASGDGFAELARYDSDANHWIDENDPVFSKLGIVVPGGAEGNQFVSLKDAGVGALFLGNAATAWDMRTPDGKQAAKLGASGFWLSENGTARALQHIDVKV
ncbi:hypothetical protein [Undibacterium squillarum]|uniref:Uncharacterized protein n=1 Tax=Undibacterium squillarum TaxID=1131567 RepID=A0ABQ2Y0F9_9BURK|nr:hypothetical protein [Undibacterium squillarum]GGX48750.1 hypothetical protein GCM10010946_29090 [Undibacterium squillarum]